MSGKRITDQQIKLYMDHRKDSTQEVAAAKAGISTRSARRIETQQLQSHQSARTWRTRSDPLIDVWDYRAAEIEEVTDPNIVHDLQIKCKRHVSTA